MASKTLSTSKMRWERAQSYRLSPQVKRRNRLYRMLSRRSCQNKINQVSTRRLRSRHLNSIQTGSQTSINLRTYHRNKSSSNKTLKCSTTRINNRMMMITDPLADSVESNRFYTLTRAKAVWTTWWKTLLQITTLPTVDLRVNLWGWRLSCYMPRIKAFNWETTTSCHRSGKAMMRWTLQEKSTGRIWTTHFKGQASHISLVVMTKRIPFRFIEPSMMKSEERSSQPRETLMWRNSSRNLRSRILPWLLWEKITFCDE